MRWPTFPPSAIPSRRKATGEGTRVADDQQGRTRLFPFTYSGLNVDLITTPR